MQWNRVLWLLVFVSLAGAGMMLTADQAEAFEVCGDGICSPDAVPSECSICPADCDGICWPLCGDNLCDGDEDCSNCPSDCGECSGDGGGGDGGGGGGGGGGGCFDFPCPSSTELVQEETTSGAPVCSVPDEE